MNRRPWIVLLLLLVKVMAMAGVTISNVKVSPISPMGMYLSYDVAGTLPSNLKDYYLFVTLSNKTSAVIYQASNYTECSLTGDVGLSIGKHRVYWDIANDKVSMPLSSAYVVELRYMIPTYCVVDLSPGPLASKYAVKYIGEIPGGTWADEYKKTKLVLKLVGAGECKGGASLSDPFYIGVFEVTQKQWELITGLQCPSSARGDGDMYPVYSVAYDKIRSSDGSVSAAVDASSFIGKLRARTGVDGFDLPTEGMWEYACRAGTSTKYSYGSTADGSYMWCGNNLTSRSSTQKVGSLLPNPWGLYDMHGNVAEWCLGYYSSGDHAIVYRGGCWHDSDFGSGENAKYCTSSYRGRWNSTSTSSEWFGFRVSMVNAHR